MAGNIKKIFVVDASFALAYLLPDEKTGFVDEIFEKYKDGRVTLYSPYIFPFEVLNGLRSVVLRKRLDKKTAFRLAEAFLSLGICLEKIDYSKVVALSFSKKLSVYDASYLLLAKTKGVSLLTLDCRLKGRCRPV